MKKLTSILGYLAAVMTLAFAVLTPFVLFGYLINKVAGVGLHIDPVYSGGPEERTIERDGYQIVVHQPVRGKTLVAPREPFVQLTWKPAAAVPPRVAEEIDINNDNNPDLRVSFEVPPDSATELRVDVLPLNSTVQPMKRVGRNSFSRLIARVGNTIVVRVPLAMAR